MFLEVITPDKKVFEGEVSGVKVPGANGSFEMLENHAAVVSSLENGEVSIRTKKGKTISVIINGGTVEMLNNKVVVLAESVVE